MLKILVVDDYENAAFVTGHIFKTLGHETELAYSGTEALEKSKTFQPDIILLDIGLPDMNGYEVCKALRGDQGLEGTLIIAQTGHGDDETIAACAAAGFDRHYLKPLDFDDIHEIIAMTG